MNSIYAKSEQEYYTNWDRTHAFSALGNYQFNKKWEMNWRLALQSGQAFTPILGYYVQKFPESPEKVFRKTFYHNLPQILFSPLSLKNTD